MRCPRCDADTPDGAKFCIECGTPLKPRCPQCGVDVLPRAKFCGECGTPLTGQTPVSPPAHPQLPLSYTPTHLAEKILTTKGALEGERKQVTVLFADVVGFSTLAERLDPEVIHTIMDGCFATLSSQVHRYEGTINQFTGDGIMALFGAPIAHEDHAARALHAALDIQAGVQAYREAVQRRWGVPLQLRLGVNTGTVVVGRIGDDLRMDYTAQGDTTNLAARLQQMAAPGTVWVGEATYRAAREAFEWRSLGFLTAKGKSQPVPAYELLGRRGLGSRFEVAAQRGLARFVGREPELDQLLAAWGRARAGQGQIVSVVGEAGLGKSRLLHECKQRLAEEGTPCIEGSCFAYGDIISYLPFLEIVKALCGLKGQTSEAGARRLLAQRLATLSVDPSAVAPYLHQLLALTDEEDVVINLTPELLRQRTVAALTALILAEARRQPWVLILEDVHWIDKASEEVLTALVEAMAAVPLLLVLVYRPEYLHRWASKAYHAQIALTRLPAVSSAAMVRAILTTSYAVRVPLARLSAEHSRAMVQDLLGTVTLPLELERLIATKTDGNPFFIEELTRSLLERGDLRPEAGAYRLIKPIETLDLPTTVQGVLLARIDRLREELKEVLQLASVIGRIFSYALLAQVAPQAVELEQVLRELEALEFLYSTSLAPQREYSFKHVLTQEVVYQTLLRPKREEYHERIGKALEALYPDRLEHYYDVLAYHYVHSGNAEKAVEYLDSANRKAAKANAMLEAKRYFDEAMALLDMAPATVMNQQRRIALLVNQEPVMNLLLKFPEYYELLARYEEMAVSVGDQRLLGAFYARMGGCACWFGAFDQAIPTLRKAAALCEAAGNTEDAGQAYFHWQCSHYLKGDYDQVLGLKEQVLRVLERRFHPRWYTWALDLASGAYTGLGRWDDAVEEAQKALHVAEEFADESLISFAAWCLSMAYTAKGDLAQAVASAELAVQKAPTPGDKVWAEGILAWAWCRAGEPRRGVELLAQAVAMLRASRFIWSEGLALFLGEGYWHAREYEQATRTLEELLVTAERCGMRFQLGGAHRLLGEIALVTNPGQRTEPLAARHFEQSLAILRAIGAENELALAYAGYGRFYQQQGSIAQARDYFVRALAIFERLGTLGEPEKVRQDLAALSDRERRWTEHDR